MISLIHDGDLVTASFREERGTIQELKTELWVVHRKGVQLFTVELFKSSWGDWVPLVQGLTESQKATAAGLVRSLKNESRGGKS